MSTVCVFNFLFLATSSGICLSLRVQWEGPRREENASKENPESDDRNCDALIVSLTTSVVSAAWKLSVCV